MPHPWHPAFVHFPIACWVLTTFFDLAALLGLVPLAISDMNWTAVSLILAWTGVLLALPTMLTGFIDYVRLPDLVQERREFTSHMTWMSLAFTLFLAAALWRTLFAPLRAAVTWYIVCIEIMGVICLVAGGYVASIIVFSILRRPFSCSSNHTPGLSGSARRSAGS